MADLQGDLEHEKRDDKHREILELLPWYLNKTLSSEEQKRVEEHLRECSSCQVELAEFEGLRQAVTVEVPQLQFSHELLEGTLERLHKCKSAEERHRLEGWRRLLGLGLRPRLALALSILAIAFLGLGTLLGLQLGAHRVIGGAPGPGQRAYQTTEQYFAFPREILLQGTFTMRIGNLTMEQESFTLERLEDGNLLLTSNIQAKELAASQRLKLSPELRPISYSLQGPLVYRGLRAEAEFEGEQAKLSVCCTSSASGQEISQRIVPLEEFPVLYDFSVMSHFALLQRVLAERLAQGIPPKELKLTAITPQALRVEPLRIEDVRPALLSSQGSTIHVTRFSITIGQRENPLRIELYAPEGEELLAIYIPVQPRLASSSAIFVYRSDLYPEGLELQP